MKNLIKIMAAAAALTALPATAAEAQSASVTTPAGMTTTVEFFTPRTARVTKTVNTATCQQSSSLVACSKRANLPSPSPTAPPKPSPTPAKSSPSNSDYY